MTNVQPLKPMNPGKAKVVTAIIMILLIGGIYLGIQKMFGSDDSVQSEKPTTSDALVASFDFVRQQLKSPSTAEFNHNANEAVKQVNDSTFNINGYVDSQNSFGATLRSTYSCTVTFKANNMVGCENLIIQ